MLFFSSFMSKGRNSDGLGPYNINLSNYLNQSAEKVLLDKKD